MKSSPKPFSTRIKRNVPLGPFTTFGIGGPARYFFTPENKKDFLDALEWALGEQIHFLVLGGGSNILVHDSGYDGLVIHTAALKRIKAEEGRIYAECGVSIDSLVDLSLERCLKGLEFAAGLPGTVGGALFMNARAYEGAFSDITESVTALHVKGVKVSEMCLGKDDFRFSYKKSVFQDKNLYVYSACFCLSYGKRTALRNEMEKNRSKRKEMGQYLFPNAGCIFKNDYRIGIPTGKILEELGLKGRRYGDAEVYEKHANFIINRGNAKAEEVYRLIRSIELEVKQRKNITLEREITLIGNWPQAEIQEGAKTDRN